MVQSNREENCIRTTSHIKVLGVCQGFDNLPRELVVPFVHPNGFEEWEKAKARELWDQATASAASPGNDTLYYFDDDGKVVKIEIRRW